MEWVTYNFGIVIKHLLCNRRIVITRPEKAWRLKSRGNYFIVDILTIVWMPWPYNAVEVQGIYI